MVQTHVLLQGLAFPMRINFEDTYVTEEEYLGNRHRPNAWGKNE